MKDQKDRHDLTFVDPDKREMVRRRIEVLEAFVAAPGRKAAEAAAAKLGMGVTAFYRLAKIWRGSHRPEDVADRRRRMVRRSRTDPHVLDIIRQTEKRNPGGSASSIAVLAAPAVLAAGLPMVSKQAVRNVVQAVRRERLAGTAAGVGICIEFSAIEMGIEDRPQNELPIAALVVDMEIRKVVGIALGPAPSARLAASALADALVNTEPAGIREEDLPVVVDSLDDPSWRRLLDVLSDSPLRRLGLTRTRIEGGRLALTLQGRKLGGFNLMPGLVTRSASHNRASSYVSLPMEASAELLRSRIHAVPHEGALRRLTSAARRSLIENLDAVTD